MIPMIHQWIYVLTHMIEHMLGAIVALERFVGGHKNGTAAYP